MMYIYVLDYSVDSIYEIKVENVKHETFYNEDAEKILVEQGFNLDEISYMITDIEQDKISMVYNGLINK